MPIIDALYAFFMNAYARRGARAGQSAKRAVRLPPAGGGLESGSFFARVRSLSIPAPARRLECRRTLAEGLAHARRLPYAAQRAWRRAKRARPTTARGLEGWYGPAAQSKSPRVRAWAADDSSPTCARPQFDNMPPRPARWPRHARAGRGVGGRSSGRSPSNFASLMAQAPAAKGAPPADKGNAADAAHPEAAVFSRRLRGLPRARPPMTQEGRPPLAWGTRCTWTLPMTRSVSSCTCLAAAGRPIPVRPCRLMARVFTDRQLGPTSCLSARALHRQAAWPDICKQ